MDYSCVTTLKKIKDYLAGAAIVAFDFETSPTEAYRSEEKAALDAHKAEITGVSFSVSEGSGIYVPLRHKTGRNIGKPEAVMEYLQGAFFENTAVVKVAHNLAFEAMFQYALGVVVQAPVYDTIAAAQLTLKSSTAFRGLSDSGLKTLVPQLFGVEMPDFQTVTGGRFFDELSPQDAETVRYACADSDYALTGIFRSTGSLWSRWKAPPPYIAASCAITVCSWIRRPWRRSRPGPRSAL